MNYLGARVKVIILEEILTVEKIKMVYDIRSPWHLPEVKIA